jgi:hypothetical protein
MGIRLFPIMIGKRINCKSLINTPASFDSAIEGEMLDSSSPTPLRKRQSLSVKSEVFIVTFIVALLSRCSPLAVFRGIVSFVVDTVYRFSSRANTHICIEVGERTAPPVTNRNSTATVIIIRIMRRIKASFLNFRPRGIGWCFGHIMRSKIGFSNFLSQATTRFCMAGIQMFSLRNRSATAGAFTVPTGTAPFIIRSAFEDSQSTKGSIREIIQISHFDTPISLGLGGWGLMSPSAVTGEVA